MIKTNLQNIHQKITMTALRCGRDPKEITLLAVSKKKTVREIEQAVSVGQNFFAENYVQEGISKIKLLSDVKLVWHFIGSLQSNKSRLVAKYFDWCHTVNSLHLAHRLNFQRSGMPNPLNVLIQINISNEEQKSGILLKELPNLAQAISVLPCLILRGIMAMPILHHSNERQLVAYHKMAEVFQQLKDTYPSVDTLSLGTSSDIDSAIIVGSTMVRVGTAIFGTRG
ncbi:Pyridoxal phosphate homeostasis protein [Candidatus Erwinia haradaeae]|uniref:Pyridoxal phosphate homeostasis protein n=1 Tax=Candidatus Erwinia haradaeae TaxID=1922217 RepID=A0A451DDM7_9GAMM|nr:YggS family pyridoxal phosphate-dependent enzyme [Candidatus Erwinia haradaeae]VFP84574.1 Pyridoxal phosphate homeostasis protein [Candidatus Erwinia haradaeae]